MQPRAVACIAELIAAEVAAGRYDPPADPQTLAYAIVRLAEAFLYNDAVIGIRGDHARLREVEAALLGVPVRPGPTSPAPPASRLDGRRSLELRPARWGARLGPRRRGAVTDDAAKP